MRTENIIPIMSILRTPTPYSLKKEILLIMTTRLYRIVNIIRQISMNLKNTMD